MSKKEPDDILVEENKKLNLEVRSLKELLRCKENDIKSLQEQCSRERYRNRMAVHMVHELVDMALYVKDKEKSNDQY